MSASTSIPPSLRKEYHAIVIAAGAETPRDLRVPGRDLRGIHFAMEFLPLNNKANAGDTIAPQDWISAAGKNVIIIGGGDTGADCLGTAHRHKARSVRQFEIMPMPPRERSSSTPWPLWPLMLREESSHEEGGERHWGILATGFLDDAAGSVRALRTINVGPPPGFEPLPGTEAEFPCELVLLAMGFIGPARNGMLDQFAVEFDDRGNVRTGADYMTSTAGIFAAGDARRGQSLVVWAIAEGRNAARAVDQWLSGSTRLA